MTTDACQPQPRSTGVSQTPAVIDFSEKQENVTIVHAYLSQPGNGGVLQSLVVFSFSMKSSAVVRQRIRATLAFSLLL